VSARRSPTVRHPVDPILWPTDVGRLHRRVPSVDPHPIVVESAHAWRVGSRRFSALLMVAFLLAGGVSVPLLPFRFSVPMVGICGLLALVCAWFALRGPFVYAWVFADDGLGYRRRDGLVAWVVADRVARVEARVVRAGRYPTLVVRVRDWKRHVVLSAKPGGFDPTELLQAAALKGYRVAGEDHSGSSF
jgi:hypothetical protein